MPLLTGTQRQYYDNSQSLVATANQTAFTYAFSPAPANEVDFSIFIDDVQVSSDLYSYSNNVVTFSSGRTVGEVVVLRQITSEEQLGNYQYIKINDIVNNFIINYVGEDKLIPKIKRTDVAFHIQRGIQELSYDTLNSDKSQEIEIPPSLKMKLPHDYVNYVKLSWVDTSGVERIIYKTTDTSNPNALLQDANYDYIFSGDDNLLTSGESETWDKFSEPQVTINETDTPLNADIGEGRRYGISPEHAQGNGVYFIDNAKGYIHFSSDLCNKIITLKYISDGLGTTADMVVHKFAEDGIYKYTAHAILASRTMVPEYLVARFKKEKFAAIRKAKLRLSNIKSAEIAQVLRNKSKVIKH